MASNEDIVGLKHVTVLARLAVDSLECSRGKIIVDATVGGGGHAELILERIGPTGKLIGIDCDEEAIRRARKRLGSGSNLILARENFRNLSSTLEHLGIAQIDALLFDLGLSTFHIEGASRGFSFKTEAPLDMRMDQRLKLTAAEIINTYSEKQLADIIKKFGEEPNARKIARAIVKERSKKEILTTTALADIVRSRAPRKKPQARIDPATRTFQALRIEVNSELESLHAAIDDGVSLLKPQGRICVISFHSLEDRIVKHTFAREARGCTCPPELPQCVCGKKPTLRILTSKPIKPSKEEIAQNPSARSAKMRVAEKLAAMETTS